MAVHRMKIWGLNALKKIPLRVVLIVPFISLVFAAVGLTGYLALRAGQSAVYDVTAQLRREISDRIAEHLRTFLAIPHQINHINADAIRLELLDIADPDVLERYFWEQIRNFTSVTSVYFGNTEGGLVDAGREGAEGSLYVIVTDEFTRGPFRKYATDSTGNRTELLTTIPDFDARTRSWYIDAVEKADAAWSEIYILFTGQDMNISASRPVYDEGHNLRGVLSTAIFLSHIRDFLQSLQIGKTGHAFMIERSGLLVASSTAEQPFTPLNGDEPQRRVHAGESKIPAIRRAAEFLTTQFGDYHNITGEHQFQFDIDGERQLLQISPFEDAFGLDWLIVVVLPESDFMQQINTNTRTTIRLCALASILAALLGIMAARWVAQPISNLSDAARALARGEWEHAIPTDRADEVGELARSFNNMAGQLQASFADLESKNAQLQQEITERKQAEDALKQSQAKLNALFGAMTEMVVLHEVVLNDRGEAVDYRITDCNTAFTTVTGIHKEDAEGKPATEEDQVESAPYLEVYGRVALTGEPYKFTVYYPPMDKHFMVSVVSPQKGRFATISTDITAIKQIQEVVSAKNKELESYLYVASHDMRSPLINIQGFSQRLQKQANAIAALLAECSLDTDVRQNIDRITGEEIPKTLDFILTNAAKMDRLINGLLHISITGRVKMSIHNIDMNSLLANVMRALSFQIEDADAQVVVDTLPECYGDAGLLDQLFTNIIGNALKYRDTDRRLVLTMTARAQYNKLTYRIHDTGIGIAQRHLDKIWDVFYQVDPQSPKVGDGIGLSIVKRIVDKHKGKISVESKEGQGSVFSIELPGLEFSE